MLSLALRRATPRRVLPLLRRAFTSPMTHPHPHPHPHHRHHPGCPPQPAATAPMPPTTSPSPRTRTPTRTPTPPPHKRRRLHSSSTTSPPPPTMTTPSPPPPPATATPRIELTETEETVRRLLVDVGAEIDTYNRTTGARNKEPIVLRFTGGWVRDKLLGVPSHDIDVGISRMTGYNFGLYLVDFLQRHYHSYGIEPGSVHRIESNPDKSKHLETATMKVLGLDIDLVNLRSEVYKGDSRVPIMEFGTPTQDALRRDCTVNALFYNLHTRRVEDFTGHGLEDMRNRIIRTPLPPQETFDDDPLRILRLVRFSSRLGFEIVPEAREAMMLPDINDALRHKISRERIGYELQKMLHGPSPHRALTLIHTHSLYTAIFAPPTQPLPPTLAMAHLPAALAATRHLNTLPTPLLPTAHDRYISWLIAALTPWAPVDAAAPAAPAGTKKAPPAAATAAREGFKVVNKVHEVLARSYRSTGAVRALLAEGADAWTPARVGGFVKALGACWRACVLAAEVLELVHVWDADSELPSDEAQKVIARYEALAARVVELGMQEAYAVKPLINGNDLVEMFGLPRGAWIAEALPRVLEWQWANPGLGREEALEWVKTQREVLAKQ